VLPAAGEGMHAADAPQALKDYTALYLSTEHRDDIGCACLFSTLGTEVARSSDETRSTLTASIRRHIETFTLTAPGRTKAERRRAAIGSWSAMIGAVVLARIANEADLSDELLASTEAWINS
jgi:TetR/AcrR family transcriptional repressor of nem operon